MVSSKHATKIVVVLMTVAMILSLGAVGYSSKLTELFGGTGVSMEYESKLFDTDEVMTVDIEMDEDDWNDMLANAMSEEYYVCNVVINGKRVNNVAIRPKGNTSLSAIVSDPDSDRYSLKLEFDHFVDGQTCYGLDKLILNNNYADSTNMKEAVIYDMYQFIGADASLYNYAEVSVNGEYTGVYLALEGVESSFMLRNYGTQDGELYKPDSMEMGGGEKINSSTSSKSKSNMDFSNFDKSNFDPKNMPARDESSQDNSNDNKANQNENTSENSDDKSSQDKNMPNQNENGTGQDGNDENNENKSRPQGGFSMGGSGANLNYTDDDLDSYSTIWEGEITSTGKKDHKRVVKALKKISEGKNLEKYLDMDNILKYMAVHTFAVNMDSLSGSMAHNYYLYEYKGQLNMLPWDYNLSFGGMSMGGTDGSGVVNDAIDTPFSGTNFFDAILEDEEYSAKFHEYLQKLVDEYVNSGRFEKVYNRIRSQIDELVKTDPTAFYNYDEYEAGAEMLYKTIMLRAESVKGQLDGTIPSTDEGQKADSSSLVDASEIDVKVMGQMNMGGGSGGFGGFGAKPGESQSDSDDKKEFERNDVVDNSAGSATTLSANTVNTVSEAPGNFDPSNMPEGFDPENMPEGFDPGDMPEGFDPGNMPEGFNPGDMPGGNSNQSGNDEKETESVSDDKDSKGGNNNQNNVTDNQNNSNEKSTENVDNNAKSESNDKSDNSNSDSNNNSDKSNSRFSDKNMPSFSGMNNSSNDKTTEKNLIIYGVCFALMILSLIVLKLMKRNY